MTKRMKAISVFLVPATVLILSLIFPQVCSESVRRGLNLGLFSALPALFPALVLSRLAVGAVPQSASPKILILPLILGSLCGFPMGAVTAAELLRQNRISKKDCEKMLFFCNNASPAFLISYFSEALETSPYFGWSLYFVQTAFAFSSFFFFFGKRFFQKTTRSDQNNELFSQSFFHLFSHSLTTAVQSSLSILSCIIFFTFLSTLISHIFSLDSFIFSLVSLFFELTGGIFSMKQLPKSLSLPLAASGVGWSGLSVHFQILSVTEKEQISYRYYLPGKILCSFLLGITSYFFEKLL